MVGAAVGGYCEKVSHSNVKANEKVAISTLVVGARVVGAKVVGAAVGGYHNGK